MDAFDNKYEKGVLIFHVSLASFGTQLAISLLYLVVYMSC